MNDWLRFAAERAPELWQRVGEHLMLTGVSTAAAVLVGLPLGIYLSTSRRAKGPVMGTIGILQTIPSLAMLVLLLALFDRIGALPALVALTLYALLPIVRNTTTGLEEVAPELVEAARGLGMTRRQETLWVRLPLAAPIIVAGIRTAAVIGVGIATLSAFIGAGGLGEFINRGLALADTDLILLGAIPAGILALAVDFSLAGMQWGLTRPRTKHGAAGRPWRRTLRPVAAASPLLLVALGMGAHTYGGRATASEGTVVVGSKNFTEQLILAEMMAQAIERRTDLRVERRLNLGGTMICHEALVRGGIDLYAEYTGTALSAILDGTVSIPPDSVLPTVRRAYLGRWNLDWLPPFGFDNTYVLAVTEREAEQKGWSSVSDLVAGAPHLRAGMTAEFAERPDGIAGFRERYGITFLEERTLDPGILYRAVAEGEVDVVFAFATDARLEEYRLRTLDDDLGYFPPYQAAPVMRAATLQAHPEVRDALEPLAGAIPDSLMRRLNYRVDVLGGSPADVAGEFLARVGIR